jgi:hypothetical protein
LIVADDAFKAGLFAPISEPVAKSRSWSERLAVVVVRKVRASLAGHGIERQL